MMRYEKATLMFPCNPYCPRGEYETTIEGKELSFKRHDMIITAEIAPFYIDKSLELFKSPKVQEEIVQPAIDLIVADIDPAMDAIRRLQELAKKGEFEKFACYDIAGYVFSIRNGNKYMHDVLNKIQEFSKIPKFALKEEYLPHHKLSQRVMKENHHVSGSSLKEAIENMLDIYAMADELRSIPVFSMIF